MYDCVKIFQAFSDSLIPLNIDEVRRTLFKKKKNHIIFNIHPTFLTFMGAILRIKILLDEEILSKVLPPCQIYLSKDGETRDFSRS